MPKIQNPIKHLFTLLTAISFSTITTAQVTTFQLDSSKFNKPLTVKLDSIYQEDQLPRYTYLNALQNKLPARQTDSLLAIMHTKDKQNLKAVVEILNQYGWQSPQKVGMNASQCLFIVIQHADLATQQKYLPMIRTAEKNGEILSSNLAILEDRINMREGKKQIYGSQSFTDKQTSKRYTYPVVDVDQLDQRRKTMGMSPMKEYIKDWDPEAYKKDLPAIEKIAQAQR